MRVLLYSASVALLALASLSIVFFNESKPFVDSYGNHASGLGLIVSVVGFALTLWTVLETLRVNSKAQEELRRQVNAARHETRDLVAHIRTKAMADTCEQAFFLATEARNAVRSGAWLRVAERCQDARQLALRLLNYRDLLESERTAIRAVAENLKAVVSLELFCNQGQNRRKFLQ